MPEFQKDIIDLNELNRKVDANRQKKQRSKKNLRRRILFLQIVCLILALVSFILCRCYVIPVWLGSIVCLICSLCSAYLTWYGSCYEKTAV